MSLMTARTFTAFDPRLYFEADEPRHMTCRSEISSSKLHRIDSIEVNPASSSEGHIFAEQLLLLLIGPIRQLREGAIDTDHPIRQLTVVVVPGTTQ